MEKELEEILKDYMTPRQIELAIPRVLGLLGEGDLCDHKEVMVYPRAYRCCNCGKVIG